MRRESLNALLIALGILAAAFGLKGFLLSSSFIDGGVTGVSMLLAKVTAVPLSVWLPLVNGGLTGAEQEILFCVVTRLEIGKVKTIVRAIDPHAFVVSHPLADAEGGVGKSGATH